MSWGDLLGGLNAACMAVFSVPVVYTPSFDLRPELGGTSVSLTGIFDERNVSTTILGGFSASGEMDVVVPHSTVEINTLVLGLEPMAGDEVIIASRLYRVVDAQTSQSGISVLTVNRIVDPFAV